MSETQEQIRLDQQKDGSARRTLHVKPGVGKPPLKKPFIAKGHDAILKGMQDNGGDISVSMISTEIPLVGKLIARDKFTITVLTDDGERVTIYKHAIESFRQKMRVR